MSKKLLIRRIGSEKWILFDIFPTKEQAQMQAEFDKKRFYIRILKVGDEYALYERPRR